MACSLLRALRRMPDIDSREILKELLIECSPCDQHFQQNISMIVDWEQPMTDDQVEAVLVHMLDLHRQHDDL